MRFGVLGPVAVWDDGGVPVAIPEAKVRALLADLLVRPGAPVSADRLIDDLWGDRPPGNPANALQAKVSMLRRVLGRERVVRAAAGYRLVVDDVDAERFTSLAERARTMDDPRARVTVLAEALALWRGPAFADMADEEFARTAAASLDDQRLAVLEEHAEARLAAGEHLLLAGELSALVAQHPLRERLRTVHAKALYLAGRQGEALATLTELRELLADELGIDPGPEATALHEAILRQDPLLTPQPAPVRPAAPEQPAAGRGTNLPVPVTGLVGRDVCVGDVVRLLGAGRLVTLVGPGGVGKTRLALEAARGAAQADGTWLVELTAQQGGPAELARHIAAVLGVRDELPGTAGAAWGVPEDPVQRLALALRDQRVLLVLDNCEHVVEAVAELVVVLRGAAPGLRVLATSREPLAVDGETVYQVEPLGEDDAVRLFAERAAASAPGFSLDRDREAVAEICRRLDGIPLALELAATRVRALGTRELAARLGDRFRVVATERRAAPARQRTLRAMIDWSWELLTPAERIVLRRLAVHRDGCDPAAAEAVCAGGGVRPDEVLGLVARLVDRSLVVMAEGPDGPRYRLLESVAAYALERLDEAEERTATRERHLRHFLALAETAEPRLRGSEQRAWLTRLDADAANLRAALDEASPSDASRLAAALTWWWLMRGRFHEARAVLSEHDKGGYLHTAFALLTGDHTASPAQEQGAEGPLNSETLPAGEHATAVITSQEHGDERGLWLYAYALFHAGRGEASRDANARAHEAFAGSGDRWGVAASLALRAMHAMNAGELDTINEAGTRAAALFRELGDQWGELQTVLPRAMLAEVRGGYEKARNLQADGLRIARDLGLRAEESERLSGLGRLALLARDWDHARELHERAWRLAAEQGYRYSEVYALMGLALGARRSGDLDAAEEQLARIQEEYDSSPLGEHLMAAEAGFIAELRGDAAAAEAHQSAGLAIALQIGEPRSLALSLEGMAGVSVLAGDARKGAWLLGAADAARREVGAPLPEAERGDVDRIAAKAASALGEDGFNEAFAEGSAATPKQAVSTLGQARGA
ncbi:BTAD domain-containing putative transcriptional regulator [Actinomadura rupiterrae]|uniref:BTAD domain-containing putative transcriptional regulator n=1 Tax=Actinomadura rupiterrae TaxID=559627 RepID=UPI0020A2EA37|nr:BTAD domain-containing putative transcriptional regulator [Actinomadura rupiterrae]MCP2339950.1 putative ATPase/DNA-binding SARP family transcriptional activator [Actinomadura rupiterrae]